MARLVIGAMARFFEAGARGAAWFPRWFARYYRVVLPGAAAQAQRERIVAAGVASASLLAAAWRSFALPDADQRHAAAALACPVLVAWARSDRVLQLWRSRPAIRRIPNARLVRFPGGHAPFLECPEAFNDALAAFLASLPPPAAAAARGCAGARGARV
jgi:4,5:9,10-diseco-3-hydroxy-5,9,17-trioxoandrosta-1(10),2-diene-4-oate hydrolase